MSELRICRICLDSKAQMQQISGSEVQDVYNQLTKTQIQDEGRLYFACYLCYCQLKKSQQLVIKSQKSEELLKQILLNHNELNLKYIESVDRQAYGLVNSLVVSNIELYQMPECHKNIKTGNKRDHDTVKVVVKDELNDDSSLVNSSVVSNTQLFQMSECNTNIKTENQRDCDTDEVVVKDEPDDDSTYTEEVWCEADVEGTYIQKPERIIWHESSTFDNEECCNVDGKQKFMQDEAKSIEIIYETQSNTVNKENDSVKQVVINNYNEYFICNDCGKKYVTKALLIKHISGHNCMMINPKNKCIKRHKYLYKRKFKNGDDSTKETHRPFECDYCSYTCSKTSHLKQHIRTHTGEKPFKCDYCNFTCSRSSHLKEHIRTHTGERPFKCDNCNFTCSRSSHLKEHIRTHTREKPFKCEYCNYTCTRTSDLKRHIMTHTGENPFKCEYCNYSCIYRGNLIIHMRTHTGEKPFKCEYCNYCCTARGNLKIHVRRHTGEKPFKCKQCNYTSATTSLLKQHMKTHARKKPF